MKRILLTMPLILVLTGCTVYYAQPGKTIEDFNRDKQYCQGIAEKDAVLKGTRICDETDLCLVNRKGWKRK